MRPVPRRRHLLAALIFLGFSALLAYQSQLNDRLSESQINIASAALKRHEPDLFAHDPTFGPTELWRFHTPAFQALLELILVPTGYEHMVMPFRILTGAVVLVYLAGMYMLLYQQCRSWSVSAFVAVLSCRMIWTLGGSYWGLGTLESMTPPALYRATIPLIVLSYLRYRGQWRVVLVLLFVGLMGNLHLVSAMNLTLVLLGAYLWENRFRLHCWPTALAGGGCALLGALPYTLYYFAMRAQLAPDGAGVSAQTAFAALRLAGAELLYPELLKPVLEWGLWAAALLILPGLILIGVERFRLRDRAVWTGFLLTALFVCFALQGVSQIVGILSDQAPPVVDFAQASTLVLLPLYVIFAQGLTGLFRLVRGPRARGTLQWACAVLALVWLVPSDNLRYFRHRVYDVSAAFMEEADKPRNIQRHHEQRRERAEMDAIAGWARENSDTGAVFLTEEIVFRLRARRSIAASPDDVKYVYYLAPWRLEGWMDRLRRLGAVLHPPTGKTDPAAVKQLTRDLAQEETFSGAAGWYLIAPAAAAPRETGILEAIDDPGWGSYYRLYEVR